MHARVAASTPDYPFSDSFSRTFVNKPGLPYARRRSFGSCQSTLGGGKHYQHDDEDCQHLSYHDNGFQCSAWRKEYPWQPRKEVEYTNNDGGPVAPLSH